MNKMRLSGAKIGIIALIALISVFSVVALTACSKNLDVAELSVVEDTVPSVAVAGEFNVSDIKLIVTSSDGNTTEIAASSSMLTTEGKAALNTVGQQNVTLFYQGKTVVISVLIVEAGTETVTVTFINGDGTSLGRRTVIKGDAITNAPTPSASDATKEFVGWFDNAGNKIDLAKVEADVTVTAKFAENANEYEVRFFDYKGNQVGNTQLVAHGQTATAPGWVVPAEIESFSWEGLDVPITSKKDFYMTVKYRSYQVQYFYVFESKESVEYAITASGRPMVESVVTGQSATKQDEARRQLSAQGLEFIRWQNTSTVINADTKMIAVVKDRTFTVRYNDGRNQSVTVTSGTTLTLKTNVQPGEGYTFNGQWEGDDGKTYSGTITVSGNLVLTPVYNRKNAPVKIVFTFKGKYVSSTGGDTTLVTATVEDATTLFEDKIDLAYVRSKLEALKLKNKGEFDGYDVESVFYGGEDVTSDGVKLGINPGDAYHEFNVVAVNSSLPTEGLNFTYDATSDGYIVASYTGDAKNIYIPASYNGTDGDKKVVGIAADAFAGKTIISVSFPETLESVGDGAFANTVLHNDIAFPVLKSFGKGVFENATTAVSYADDDEAHTSPIYASIKITFASGENSFTEMDGNIVRNSKGITEIVLPAQVTKIGARDIDGSVEADDLTKIDLSNVTELGDDAFFGSFKLASVGSLANIAIVGNNAFRHTAITELDMQNLKSVGTEAFADMASLTNADIAFAAKAEGEDYETFDLFALRDASALTEITFGNNIGIVKNGASVVLGLSSLVKITLGENVSEFNVSATALPALEEVAVSAKNAVLTAKDGVLFVKEGEGYALGFYPMNKLGDYAIPDKINDTALVAINSDFAGATINALTLGAEAIALTKAATFNFVGTVTGLVLNYGQIESFDETAFVDEVNGLKEKIAADTYYLNVSGVENMTEIIANASWTDTVAYDSAKGTNVKYDAASGLIYIVNTVGGNKTATVISGNKAASAITVPATLGGVTVTAIDKNAFVNYANLKTLEIKAKLSSTSNLDGCVSLEKIVFAGWLDGADYTVTGFGETALGNKTNVLVLGNVLIAYNFNAEIENPTVVTAENLAGVAEIPEEFFKDSDITAIYLPDSVLKIGAGAFKNCASLENIDVNKVTFADDEAFFGCAKLTDVTLPEVVSLGVSAFEDCAALTSVYIPKRINAGLIPVRAFYGCGSLVRVDIPEVIGFAVNNGVSLAFGNCASLEDISFINRFSSIAGFAFAGCFSIKKVDFTVTTVTSIGKYAFSECSGIEYIVFSASVTSIGEKAFFCNYENSIKSIEFKGSAGLLALDEISADVFPATGYTFYVSGGADTSALKNYPEITIRTSAPTVEFRMYEGFAANGALNMPALNDTLYVNAAPTAPEFAGYVFSGWFVSKNGAYARAEFPYNVTENTVFYAKYFDVNKGSLADADLTLTKDGYILNKLTASADGELYIPARYRNDNGDIRDIYAIDVAAFASCDKITEIVIPEGVKVLFATTVSEVNTTVTKISVPSTVSAIEGKAFASFTAVEEFVFADGIDMEIVGKEAFENTKWYLKERNDASSASGSGFILAGNVAIEYVSDEESVDIPAGVTVLVAELFKDNASLKEIRLNRELKIIGERCFYNATNLEFVSYASGNRDESVIKEIGSDAFTGTLWLKNQDMVIVGTVLTKYNDHTGDATVNIPDGITEIAAEAFAGSSVKNVVFGAQSKLTKIDNGAFRNSSLEAIVLPAITELGDGAFENCVSLRRADFSKATIETLPVSTFSGCVALESVILSDAVAKISTDAFGGCVKLASIKADGVNVIEGLVNSGIKDTAFANPEATEKDQFIIIGKILIKYVPATAAVSEDDDINVVEIPDGVESIMKEVFLNNSTINEIVIPASVRYVGESAFSNSSKLTAVKFAGDGLEEIAADAFKNCTALTDIALPSTLTSVGNRAFAYSGITEITIGDAVVTVGERAFYNSALEYVRIGAGIENLGEEAFAACTNLYKVEWSWTVDAVYTENNVDYNAFDVIIANIEKALGATAEEDHDSFAAYVNGIFAGSSRSVRIYFNRDAYNYMSNGTGKALETFRELSGDVAIYRDGVFPTVSFNHDTSSGQDYFMNSFNAEVIETIGTPSMTGRTFKRWLINGQPLVLPYKVFSDIALTPEWFINDITSDSSDELGFTETGAGYVINRIKEVPEDGILYVPSTVKGKPVVGVKLSVTTNADQIKKIVLTNASAFNGLTENVFSALANLTEISLLDSDNVASDMKVEDGALYSSDGTTLIAYLVRYAEDGETALTDFVVPETVVKIAPYAFVNSGLTSVTISKNVQVIGAYAFNDELAAINFAEGIFITDATKESFANTAWYDGGDNDPNTYGPTMSQYVIDRSTVGLFFTAGNILYEYKWISTASALVIPDNVNGFDITVIASDVNSGDEITFSDLVLPAGLRKINSNAFSKMDVTKSITTKSTVLTDIASNVFDKTLYYISNNDMFILGSVLVKCQNTTGTIVVPEGVVSISDEAFNGGQVRNITLPSTLKYIGNRAFYNCTNLVSVSIPAGVTEIGDQAFAICQKLEQVTFNAKDSKLVKIGEGAFSECSLTSINVPYTVESIGKEAFMSCRSLATVNFDYIVVTTNEDNTTTTTVVAKSNLTELGESAFYNCNSLRQISVPNGVSVIKERTFYNCYQLVNVEFDVSLSAVKTIETQAFYGCTSLGGTVDLNNPSLVTLVLPNKLEVIQERAFANCSSLLGVQLNYNVAVIENYAFYGCLRLAKIDIYSATPATISDNTFFRGTDEGSVNPYYNLRIYVRHSVGGTVLDNYKKSGNWALYRDLIHENDDIPTLKFRRAVSSGTGEDIVSTGELASASDIVIDPKFSWGSAVYSSWQYFDFKQKEYDAEGNFTGNYVTKNSDPRYERMIESLSYQTQRDERGDTHIILVVDYDEMTLNYRSTN